MTEGLFDLTAEDGLPHDFFGRLPQELSHPDAGFENLSSDRHPEGLDHFVGEVPAGVPAGGNVVLQNGVGFDAEVYQCQSPGIQNTEGRLLCSGVN